MILNISCEQLKIIQLQLTVEFLNITGINDNKKTKTRDFLTQNRVP
jgi:hypothetical protein